MCARCCSRHWGYGSREKAESLPSEVPVGEIEKQTNVPTMCSRGKCAKNIGVRRKRLIRSW